MAAESLTLEDRRRSRDSSSTNGVHITMAEETTCSQEGRRRNSSLERKGRGCGHSGVPPDVAKTARGLTWFTPSPSSSAANPRSYRQLCTELISRRLPEFEPRDDFDLLATGFSDIKANPEQVRAWVDAFSKHVLDSEFHGNKRALEHLVAAKLDARTDVTGLKPSLGDPGVVIELIPSTPYSVRIWPGSRFRAEYCVDFVIVDGDTITPVNTPPGFQIWIVFPPYLHWKPVQITSLDQALSTIGTLEEGVEKYVVRDGEKCLVARGNTGLLTFQIPERPHLDPPDHCLAGTCTGRVNSELGALDLNSTLYYNVAPSV